ncbi:hypothetical protein [Rhizobacter sp. Root1221]|uniref:hypothetical protein n=1 Tax=Rhizobacter sp. Root1221 TaxID=1736433 RepID=UPI000713749D|nr:hypothetical protein [Rhizobacter sp. Root1221]KQV99971.1 hypothetical protein ASC87_19920 [Rhizobacter sp. Root1221]
MLTRLEAVNQIMVAIGESVILQEIEGAGDYANASAVIDAETRKVLAKGWSFNTEIQDLSPDVDGIVTVADNVLSIDPVDPGLDAVQRGARLYDRKTRSFVFTAPVEVRVILNFPFEDVPYAVQNQIVAMSAKKYQRGYVSSDTLDNYAREESAEAGADAADAESDVDDYNILDNPDLAYLRRRSYRGPL